MAGVWAYGGGAGGRVLGLDDLAKLQDVSDPRVSPDGAWVAYAVASVDEGDDKRVTHLWMASWDGKQRVQLTYGKESASSPRWSPDGKYLAFLSSRAGAAKGEQVWLMDRRGGEAEQLTAVKGKLSAFEWSPDSQRLALVMKETKEDKDEKKDGKEPAPKPIVIDRYHFKEDAEGYLTGEERNLIWLFDVKTKKAEALTGQKQFDERSPAWSPDGTRIAFVSNQDKDWDRTENTDVFVAEAKAGSAARRLTTYPGPDGGRALAWSPDGKWIAFTRGSEPKLTAYSMNRLAVVPAAGGEARVLTDKLDRSVAAPMFTDDGAAVMCLVADDRSEYVARVSVDGGGVERVTEQKMVVMVQSANGGHRALLAAMDGTPAEVYALDGGGLRKLSAQNEAWMEGLRLGETRDVSFHSKDGTEVHGLLTLPPDYQAGTKAPMLLRIHGGPNGQDGHAFQFERQLFAAHGYAVLNVNYRGSSGRGAKYQRSIFADWGDLEVQDLLAGVDAMVKEGIADPDRLGIGGWSYGGILTDYTIASDSRFKAAISGAGSANQITMYGVDQYVFQYDHELGPPWKSEQLWVKISYPFFHADRIHTPTMFLGGDQDFNVPVVGGEQMYQALQTLGVPTEMIIYPGQHHGIARPSFVKDRLQRYLDWYDKYVKAPAGGKAPERAAR